MAFSILFTGSLPAIACSRVVYLGKEQQIITGRTMDWREDMHSNLWIFPRNMPKKMGENGYEWKSKYGSLIASGYESGTADGMNEKGLVANILFLAESEFPDAKGDIRPIMPVSAWAQYILDRYETVSEAVAAMKKEPFRLVSVTAPNGVEGTVHLSVSDRFGDSAIFQYINGKLDVFHGKQYQVMTNSPVYGKQIALNEYWKDIGGTVMLPGTNRASDRFVRASFYINAVTQTENPREATAAVLSVIRNVSVPRGITTPDKPNIASTIWRSMADHKNLIYYFEDTLNPSLIWIDLKKINFDLDGGVRKLSTSGNKIKQGEQNDNFHRTTPFVFLLPE